MPTPDTGQSAHLRNLADITFDPNRPFGERLGDVFELESERLELPYGFLTRVDEDAGRQDILRARGSHELLNEGETAPLSKSYCRRTIETDDGMLVVDDAVEDGWSDDPAYQLFELGTYVGVRIEAEPIGTGTLCLASSDPRPESLDSFAVAVVSTIAKWASYELTTRPPDKIPASAATPTARKPTLERTDELDATLDCLSTPIRRATVRFLAERSNPSISVEELATSLAGTLRDGPDSPEALSTALYHHHLPKLQQTGLIDLDSGDNTISYHSNELVEYLLEAFPAEAGDEPR